jgi:hypothetical protein
MVQIRFTNLHGGMFEKINTSMGLNGSVEQSRQTIARAQSISTNDATPYSRVRQIGYGTIVEDVPLFTEGSGNISAIETVDAPSLYKIGIYDFVNYLFSCVRNPIEIAILAPCLGAASSASNVGPDPLSFGDLVDNAQTIIDRLTQVKFTAVARAIDVGGQLVSNSASFYYIRTIDPNTYLANAH